MEVPRSFPLKTGGIWRFQRRTSSSGRGQVGVRVAVRWRRVCLRTGGRAVGLPPRRLGSSIAARFTRGCPGSSERSRRELRNLICSISTTAGGSPDSRCKIWIRVVLHTGRTARAAAQMALSMISKWPPQPVLTMSPPRLAAGLTMPGHQASAPYVATGRMHAAAALAVAAGGVPLWTLLRLRRCWATFSALAPHLSVCSLKESLESKKTPSHRTAPVAGATSKSPVFTTSSL
ncbi:hypothetical protein F4804DRAFT_181015 [Jackrogersella minutella]|nr:hypothetical protein F4804DRAFT_181015 [Jackrogersella minutella]